MKGHSNPKQYRCFLTEHTYPCKHLCLQFYIFYGREDQAEIPGFNIASYWTTVYKHLLSERNRKYTLYYHCLPVGLIGFFQYIAKIHYVVTSWWLGIPKNDCSRSLFEYKSHAHYSQLNESLSEIGVVHKELWKVSSTMFPRGISKSSAYCCLMNLSWNREIE